MITALKARFKQIYRQDTARLLFFEFVVVLAGVLVAQLLQGWFEDRQERSRAQSQISGIATSLHNSAELALIRRRMNICMRDRIERVRDALAQPTPDQSDLAWVRVPEQNVMDDPGIDAARPLITKVYGPDQMVQFNLIEFAFDTLYAGQNDELAAWQTLALLHPANGRVDPALRPQLQLALADAQRANRLMFEVSGIMRRQSGALQTPIHDNTIASFAQSPKLCAGVVAFTDEQHDTALEQGKLPDGTPIHPRVLQQQQPSYP